MIEARLKRIARLMTDVSDCGPRPLIALEHLESGTGKLLPGVDVKEIHSPGPGVADIAVGDVLFGKLRPYLAKTWVADRPSFASTELLCLRPRDGVDSRWFGYVVASSPFIDWAVATSDGAKMPRTNWEKLGEFRMTIPSLTAQVLIADYLDLETARIDSLIAAKRRMVELLEERNITLIHELTSRGARECITVDTQVHWLGAIPAHWQTMQIRRVGRVRRGASPRPIDDPIYFDDDGEYAWVRIADVTDSGRYLTDTTQRLSQLGSSLRAPNRMSVGVVGGR